MAETCATCRFWRDFEGSGLDATTLRDCRRRAPIALTREEIGAYVYADWPVTGHDDWCGEHQKEVSE